MTESEKTVVKAQIKGLVPAIRLAIRRNHRCSGEIGEALNALRSKRIFGGFPSTECSFVSDVTSKIEFDTGGYFNSSEAMRMVCQLAEMIDLPCEGFFADIFREPPSDSD